MREKRDYQRIHINTAINIPLSVFKFEKEGDEDLAKKLKNLFLHELVKYSSDQQHTHFFVIYHKTTNTPQNSQSISIEIKKVLKILKYELNFIIYSQFPGLNKKDNLFHTLYLSSKFLYFQRI